MYCNDAWFSQPPQLFAVFEKFIILSRKKGHGISIEIKKNSNIFPQHFLYYEMNADQA